MNKFTTQLQSYLTKDEIKQMAPVVFADKPTNTNVSSKYLHVNTETIIDDLDKLGWKPVMAQQRKTKVKADGSTTIRSKHMVSFQNPDIMIKGKDGDDAFPRIILTNSHDGFNSFQFRVGIYRLVCSNGLVVADEEFSAFSIKHKGYTFDELRTVVSNVVDELPNKVLVLNKMQTRMLSQTEMQELAIKAMQIRADKLDAQFESESVDNILTPTRKEDEGQDLWTVFNVLQEKIINGGYGAALKGAKIKKVRRIKSFEKDLKINQDLFKAALELVN